MTVRLDPAEYILRQSRIVPRDASPKMSENALLRAVRDLATMLGWTSYHTLWAQGSEAGFPDLTMVRAGRVLFAELKSDKGATTPSQRRWLWSLAEAGAEVHLWRPDDLDTRIPAVLR